MADLNNISAPLGNAAQGVPSNIIADNWLIIGVVVILIAVWFLFFKNH